jgi:hypothetical protein
MSRTMPSDDARADTRISGYMAKLSSFAVPLILLGFVAFAATAVAGYRALGDVSRNNAEGRRAQ